jgi:hypothetical protein
VAFAWTDSIPDSQDVSDVTLVSKLVTASNQRLSLFDSPGSALTVPTAGTDVQAASFWHNLQFNIKSLVGQGNIVNSASITGGVAYDGTNTTSYLDHTIYFVWSAFATAVSMTGGDFRRQKPRQITSLFATIDTDSNPIASGMKAQYTDGKGYKYNGSAWVLNTLEPTDMLDSAAAAPSHCAPGLIQSGDYLGGWLAREIRDAFNILYSKDLTTVANYWGCDGTAGVVPGAVTHFADCHHAFSATESEIVSAYNSISNHSSNFDPATGINKFWTGGDGTGTGPNIGGPALSVGTVKNNCTTGGCADCDIIMSTQ